MLSPCNHYPVRNTVAVKMNLPRHRVVYKSLKTKAHYIPSINHHLYWTVRCPRLPQKEIHTHTRAHEIVYLTWLIYSSPSSEQQKRRNASVELTCCITNGSRGITPTDRRSFAIRRMIKLAVFLYFFFLSRFLRHVGNRHPRLFDVRRFEFTYKRGRR